MYLATGFVLAGLLLLAGSVLVRRTVVGGIVRAAAEARLSAALGQPVAVGDVSFSLAPRPVFTGADVRIGAAGLTAPAVRLDRIHVFPRLRSFFSRTVQIDEIRLDGFEVSLLRDAGGRWHAPAFFPGPSEPGSSAVNIGRVRVTGGRLRVFDGAPGRERETARIDGVHADMLIQDGGLRLAPLGGRVGSAAIEGEARVDPRTLRLEFSAPSVGDPDLPALLGLLGASRPAIVRLDQPAAASVTMTVDRASARLSGNGSLRIPVLVVDPLRLERVEAPYTIDGARITLTPMTFTVNGGGHRGRVVLAFDGDPPRWSAKSRVDRLDLGGLLDVLAARDAGIDGAADVEADVSGRLVEDFVNGIAGGARLAVSNGVLHDFPLVATINRALRLTEGGGNDTRFERLTATLALAGGAATTGDLLMHAGHLRVALVGRIGFDRTLDLRGRAFVSKERAAEVVRRVRELARARKGSGEIELPLRIGGSLDAPRFEIDMETALREGVRDELERRLRRLFRREP